MCGVAILVQRFPAQRVVVVTRMRQVVTTMAIVRMEGYHNIKNEFNQSNW
jgi:hypothetical protein